MLDYDLFAATPLANEPYDHMVVPGFLPLAEARAVAASFPGRDLPGVLPAPKRGGGDPFGQLLNELRGPRLTQVFAEKYGLPLSADTLMITLRARTRPQDGQIHTDSKTKEITALIYLNTDWSDAGGRLRVLRSPDDLEDMAAEVPPVAGTLITFRRTEHSWHGHKPISGPRRAIQLNWVTSQEVVDHEQRRHQISTKLKKFKNLFIPSSAA